jgi:DNA-binding phage protein|tara:strand:+ start:1415 stop:1633 length:219 start_codon:yes stop_codon:yes gene_type:complete
MELKFNVSRLVQDCGGVSQVAELLGNTRTAPYRAMRTGYLGTPTLARLLEHYPNLNINSYFEETKNDRQATD